MNLAHQLSPANPYFWQEAIDAFDAFDKLERVGDSE
jgi:hypothetical protein